MNSGAGMPTIRPFTAGMSARRKPGIWGTRSSDRRSLSFSREFTAYVHRIAPDKPVMLAPNCWNVPGAEATYRQLLPQVDILCPFGFHRMPERGQTGEQAAALLQLLCDETGAHLWMDMEVFLFNEHGALIPRPMGGLLTDLLRFPNFEKIICYQYPGLLTAPDASIKPGGDAPVKLYLDYKKYLEMGVEAFQLRHAARGAAVNLSSPPAPKYPGRHGAASLTDGETGETDYLSPAWLGFQGDDVVAVIDLRRSVSITDLQAQFLQFLPGGIFLPVQVEFAVGDTPASLHQVKTVMPGLPLREAGPAVSAFAARDLKVEGRYVQVRATNIGKIPAGHPAAGANAWVFVDEVMVNPAQARQ